LCLALVYFGASLPSCGIVLSCHEVITELEGSVGHTNGALCDSSVGQVLLEDILLMAASCGLTVTWRRTRDLGSFGTGALLGLVTLLPNLPSTFPSLIAGQVLEVQEPGPGGSVDMWTKAVGDTQGRASHLFLL
jgi:hypothetical protein